MSDVNDVIETAKAAGAEKIAVRKFGEAIVERAAAEGSSEPEPAAADKP